ncbi:hypothetical protein SPBR_08763 [Sporothrix brasiliensis 5110]|uniref:Uncharacterized protein n=1 Tax=Sporothrix brasiliensis 5110 TaxID=1398154 RepID=A0A0C2F7A0_9PEZI|nr:uncharacterized protein SPBR_08763 [Sporothrix brasiliensis 5110]KIH86938.1 hypothetical protein SPBR_08763 [Sporothrix brasiliensis 5110]
MLDIEGQRAHCVGAVDENEDEAGRDMAQARDQLCGLGQAWPPVTTREDRRPLVGWAEEAMRDATLAVWDKLTVWALQTS